MPSTRFTAPGYASATAEPVEQRGLWEAVLRTYRLNSLKDGRIISTSVFEAPDDAAAIETARLRSGRVDGELWRGSRLIAAISALPEPE